MLWSDHEIRDGWGSWASDSPTLQAKYPRGAAIAAQYNAYFEDARKVYWHFQMCHNLATPIAEPYVAGTRTAIPVQFQCGRLSVVMLDDRGERDLWRESNRALGDAQWSFLENELLPNLPPDVDALAIATQGPIVGMAPGGEAMRRVGSPGGRRRALRARQRARPARAAGEERQHWTTRCTRASTAPSSRTPSPTTTSGSRTSTTCATSGRTRGASRSRSG